ncbi:MAG: chemotaxis protein CheW [Vicinamibacterales bacterium]|nr:chemotaxis protein CheW [Vicinamibacterales bacterium]
MMTIPASTSRQLATFTLGDMYFGVEVLQVQEVIRYQEMTAVPRAPAVVRGLINLRGQIVTAIDLRRRLSLPALDADRRPMNVVVRTGEGVISLLVDEIGDVLEVEGSCFEPAPDTLVGPTRELVTCVFKLSGRLLLVLDVERTVSLDDEAALLDRVA